MKNNSRGSILIVVVGVLAMFFILGVTAIIISSSGAKQVMSDRDAFLARLGADSACEYSLGVIADFQSRHATKENGMATSSEELDEATIDAFVATFQDLITPPDNKLHLLRDSAGSSIFDLSHQYDKPYQFDTATTENESELNAFAYLENDEINSSEITYDQRIEPGGFVDLENKGTWKINIYGWGLTSLLADSILPAGASMFAKAQVELEFKVAVNKDEVNNRYLISVYFPDKFKLRSRKFSDRTAEFIALPWPYK